MLTKQLFKKEGAWIDLLILALAVGLRLWALDLKPPHFDEGINGWFADRLREQGFYAYDPTNYHGPLYFYVLFLFQTLLGRSLWALRLPAVLGSIASVWLALRFDRFFGKEASRWGALALAVSPAMVFYGRYAIHESWVASSLMVVLLGLFGLWTLGDRYSLFLTILGVTLLILLKETAVIHFCSLLAVTASLLLWRRVIISPRTPFKKTSSQPLKKEVHFSGLTVAEQAWSYRDLGRALLFSLGVIFFFYSGGLLHIHGFLDLFRTLSAWAHTGTKTSGHLKSAYQWGPFNYYWLSLMAQYETASLLGFCYSLWLFWKGSKLARIFPSSPHSEVKQISALAHYMAIYGLGAFVLYSIIPYKTPWCLISIVWPFSLLFGVFLQHLQNKKVAKALGISLLGLSLFICVRLNFWHYADFSEPYVYVQTSPQINRLTAPLLAMAKKDPRNFHLRGQILLESYYPLPWVLGDFTCIGYFSKKNPPRKFNGDFIVVSKTERTTVESQLHEPYYQEEFQLRDAMTPCEVYFKKATFENFFHNEKGSVTVLRSKKKM